MGKKDSCLSRMLIRIIVFQVFVCIMALVMDTSSKAAGTPQYIVDDFVRGGIWSSDGSGKEYDDSKRMRTGYWPLGDFSVKWSPDAELQYCVVFYDDNYNFLTATSYQSQSADIREGDLDGAKYVRFVVRHADKKKTFSEPFKLPEGCSIISDMNCIRFYDTPENAGIENVISRAEQCAAITYSTKAVLPAQKGDIAPDTEIQGIMYSSTREESLYVPNAVSFESYLSAINDPKSYIYTRVSNSHNSRTYYGTVCSAFVSYCYDLPCIYTTYQLGLLKQMKHLDDQSVEKIKLGDMILNQKNHVCIVIGIERDYQGKIIKITEAEAKPSQVRVRTYSAESFINTLLNQGYEIYRFSLIDRVSPPNEDLASITINENLCPRRGNKANWPMGEKVEIDILDAADYDKVELYSDGRVRSVSDIPESMCISYSGLASGKYEVFLSNEKSRSDPVSFIVVDTDIRVEKLGNGIIKLSFSSSNATPKWYAWCFANEKKNDYMAVTRAYTLSEEDIKRGYTISKYETGEWFFKVEFETEYGYISSACILHDVS